MGFFFLAQNIWLQNLEKLLYFPCCFNPALHVLEGFSGNGRRYKITQVCTKSWNDKGKLWSTRIVPSYWSFIFSLLPWTDRPKQAKDRTRLWSFSWYVSKNAACQGFCQGDLSNVQMPAYETILCFLSTPPVPVEILTPHPHATHTGKASRWCPQENSALKTWGGLVLRRDYLHVRKWGSISDGR